MSQEDIDNQVRILVKDPGNLQALVRFITYIRRVTSSHPLDYSPYAPQILQALRNYVNTLDPYRLSNKDWIELFKFITKVTDGWFLLHIAQGHYLRQGGWVSGSREIDRDLPFIWGIFQFDDSIWKDYWSIRYTVNHGLNNNVLTLEEFRQRFPRLEFVVTETLPF